MKKRFAPGDLVTTRIIAFDRTRDPMLTIQERDLGKISHGKFLKISSTRVPRLIGKRGSMIQTIEQATQTKILIGQNGILVVSGKNDEGIGLAFKAIKMVEEEAHTSNLTQKIKDLLNVKDELQVESENNSSGNNEAYINSHNENNSKTNDVENNNDTNNEITKTSSGDSS
jgi:exosome complex component RRP4